MQQVEGERSKQANSRIEQLWPLFKCTNSRKIGPRPQEVVTIHLSSCVRVASEVGKGGLRWRAGEFRMRAHTRLAGLEAHSIQT